MAVRDIKGGYWNALTRRIPVSKTHYISALQMTVAGHGLFLLLTTLLAGLWFHAVATLLLVGWIAYPRPYKRTPITKDTFL